MSARKGPLAGIRVLELARILAGPWAGQMLADLGADVIKVERPGAGDDTRGWGPPFMEDKDGGRLELGLLSRLQPRQALDRGRLRDAGGPAHRQKARGALRRADRELQVRRAREIRPRLREPAPDNPRLVYCSITGFGQDGPYATRAGYDLLVQGMGGIMDITGEPDGEPTRLGVAFADVFTGVYSALAIQAALQGARDAPARAATSTWRCSTRRSACWPTRRLYYLVSGKPPQRHGQRASQRRALPDLPVADGHMLIACGNDGQFAKMCRCWAIRRWRRTSASRTNPARVVNREHTDPAPDRVDRQTVASAELAEKLRRSACRPARSTDRARSSPIRR